jgi:hypothetical protein
MCGPEVPFLIKHLQYTINSVEPREDGDLSKITLRNLEETEELVIKAVSSPGEGDVRIDHNPSEVTSSRRPVSRQPSARWVKAPRVCEAQVIMACVLDRVLLVDNDHLIGG